MPRQGPILLVNFLLVLLSQVGARKIQISVTGTGFGPASQNAAVGDTVDISFTVGTASFTQSTFNDPCTPVAGGLDSGVKAIASGAGPQSFSFTVKTSSPLYFFNSVKDQCKAGFVFTLNGSAQQLSQFKSNAANSDKIVRAPSPIVAQQPAHADSQPGDSSGSITIDPVHQSQTPAGDASTSVPPHNTPLLSSGATTATTLGTATSDPQSPAGSSSPARSRGPPSSTPPNPTPGPGATLTTASAPTTSPTARGSDSSQRKGVPAAQIVGILFGVLALVAIAIILLVRLRRKRKHLLPTSVNPLPDFQGLPNAPSSGVRVYFSRLFSKSRAWTRLDEKEERKISPFRPEHNARMGVVDEKIVTRSDSPTMGRHLSLARTVSTDDGCPTSSDSMVSRRRLSQATLVAEDWRTERRQSVTGSSLVAEASETEKSIVVHRGRIMVNPASAAPSSTRRKSVIEESPV